MTEDYNLARCPYETSTKKERNTHILVYSAEKIIKAYVHIIKTLCGTGLFKMIVAVLTTCHTQYT